MALKDSNVLYLYTRSLTNIDTRREHQRRLLALLGTQIYLTILQFASLANHSFGSSCRVLILDQTLVSSELIRSTTARPPLSRVVPHFIVQQAIFFICSSDRSTDRAQFPLLQAAMAAETPSSGSLADRITKPDTKPTPFNATVSDFKPASGTSWADDVDSPADTEPPAPSDDHSSNNQPTTTSADANQPSIPQMDGAPESFGGSQLQEPTYSVEVKLADMQADPNNPLYSVKAFNDLGLYGVLRNPLLCANANLTSGTKAS